MYQLVNRTFLGRLQFKRYRVGRNSYVDPTAQLIGWSNIYVGINSTISEDVWINVNHRDRSTRRVIIGNNCHIGKRNFLSSGPIIHIKDYGFTGVDCHFLGCGHNIESPMRPYLVSGLSAGAPIELGVNCWLTTAVTVMENVKIGHGSIVGAHSVVAKDLPPFCIAIGSPCKVIKRFDFKSGLWIPADQWIDELDSYLPAECDYLAQLEKNYRELPPALLASSRRFGWI